MDAQVPSVRRTATNHYTVLEQFDVAYWNSKGFVVGLGRDIPKPKLAHLYAGAFHHVGDPLCWRGWNRPELGEYSIWRNNIGEKGVCKMCIQHARRILKKKSTKEASDE